MLESQRYTYCPAGVRLKCLKHTMARSELVVQKKASNPFFLVGTALSTFFLEQLCIVSAVWNEMLQTKSLHVQLGSELRNFVKSSNPVSPFFVFQLGSLHKDACQGCEEAPSCCATFCLQVPGKKGIQEVAMENWIHSLVAP